jgi:hypothetical protein
MVEERRPVRVRAPRKKPFRRHRGGIVRIPACRSFGNMPWPVFQDGFGNSFH